MMLPRMSISLPLPKCKDSFFDTHLRHYFDVKKKQPNAPIVSRIMPHKTNNFWQGS